MQFTFTIDDPEHHVVTLPAELPAGRIKLTAVVDDELAEPGDDDPNDDTPTDIDALFALVRSSPPSGRTKEEIDAYLRGC